MALYASQLVSSVSAESRVGDVLASKYRLEQLLGSGGMGDVYRAVNEHVGRPVAIKLLKTEHTTNAQVVDRFMREAKAANLVRHPNVVDVLDIGKDDSGTPFIVQELLAGEDLGQYVLRRGGKLELDEIVELLQPVLEALAEAHAQGVVHRDIKPENVFLANQGKARVPKLLDFGISKVRASNIRTTEVGEMMGTPAYMPPEQVTGARAADPRSDVWAFGVMLFELASGRLPFEADNAPNLFYAIATQDAPSLVDVDPSLSETLSKVVGRCLRREPGDRYPSAAELARDLKHVVDGFEPEPTHRRSAVPPAIAPPATVESAPTLEVPDLDVPAPRISIGKGKAHGGAATVALGPTSPPAIATPPVPPIARPSPAVSRPPVATAPLSGVMMGPSSPSMSPRRAPPPASALSDAPRDNSSEHVSLLVALGVIGVVLIAGFGVLMKTVHRPEGWAVIGFLIQPSATVNLLAQGALALVPGAVGISYTRRAFKHWRGELGGGIPNAIINALVASGAFFAAVELVSAAT